MWARRELGLIRPVTCHLGSTINMAIIQTDLDESESPCYSLIEAVDYAVIQIHAHVTYCNKVHLKR